MRLTNAKHIIISVKRIIWTGVNEYIEKFMFWYCVLFFARFLKFMKNQDIKLRSRLSLWVILEGFYGLLPFYHIFHESMKTFLKTSPKSCGSGSFSSFSPFYFKSSLFLHILFSPLYVILILKKVPFLSLRIQLFYPKKKKNGIWPLLSQPYLEK